MRGELLARFVRDNPQAIPRLNKVYVREKPAQVLAAIVDTRGFLHHHSRKNRDAWHPDKQADYEPDAVIIEEIAYRVLWELTSVQVFGDAAVRRYQELVSKGLVR